MPRKFKKDETVIYGSESYIVTRDQREYRGKQVVEIESSTGQTGFRVLASELRRPAVSETPITIPLYKVGDSVTVNGWVMFVTKGPYTYRGKQVVDVRDGEVAKLKVPVSEIAIYTIPTDEELITALAEVASEPINKYQKTIVNQVGERINIDVYDVLNAFKVTDPAIAHAIKKLLMPGQRGHKTIIGDLKEAIVSIERAIDQQTNVERFQ